MTDVKPTVTEVIDKLAALGSGRQIAEYFEAEGVVGDRSNPYACPVVTYVKREASADFASASTWAVSIYDADPERGAAPLRDSVEVADGPVESFIFEFDKGQYPNLIREGH